MESSQVFGAAEECHSSESGWTMYIGSPIYGDDDDGSGDNGDSDDENDGDGDNDDDDDENDANHDDDSDDSMASDASSGPSHQGHPCGSGKGGHGLAAFKQEDEENYHNYRLDKKANKQQQKEKQIRAQKMKEEKEEKLLRAKIANASAQSTGAKVRKKFWM
ncbi:hypothetical protein I3760_15G100500 [Carya illinoinensis]|uniref:Uncharacterized protein n=1 Tax=Carya illinoinensis TaxID=32201 RepID=A0A8T1N6I4_CARIL|nr:protein SOB FIVE-LIKE 2-like [Carya illinoinensis]KAG2667189.1 hypothetical protein I3760_15G100500 [Carya illinoinensis]KAG6619767.1 hypothetical protein I3842_Q083100 [Carya illinoinensis]KAG6619768.1 hypothetical protein I3842_Q083100 [Carya illinoinensis]KAG6627299.1 hypothetical protein CIPAW_15G117600 [Carya illinoinensis]KAG6627300.1 hypothetical protein CIPAW_15G117600 [Carya illinoinensis]